MHLTDLLQILAILLAVAIMAFVLRSRRRGKTEHDQQFATDNICDHLKPALEFLESKGHIIKVVGQNDPQLPLEIHLQPPFDPAAVYQELKLEPPVYVSERNVLYCKEDWCELHPMR